MHLVVCVTVDFLESYPEEVAGRLEREGSFCYRYHQGMLMNILKKKSDRGAYDYSFYGKV